MISHGPASQDDPGSAATRVAAGMRAHADTIGASNNSSPNSVDGD